MNLGAKIKQRRVFFGLTQEELASRCELTKSYISQLENNKTSPSLATLTQILEVLGTNLGDFFEEEKKVKLVFNKEEQIESDFDGYNVKWLIPTSQKLMMEPIIVEIEPFKQTIENEPHEGEEFGYVLDGEVEVVCGNNSEICKSGQAFYFERNKIHYLKNKKNKKAVVMWISCPPNF